MVARLRALLRSGFGLAIYFLCTAVVCSFILFEVLDVDGSDFPGRHATAATSAMLSEAAHDIRRTLLSGPVPGGVGVPLPSVDWFAGVSGPPRPAASTAPPAVLPHAHRTRLTLPRATLDGPSPSA